MYQPRCRKEEPNNKHETWEGRICITQGSNQSKTNPLVYGKKKNPN